MSYVVIIGVVSSLCAAVIALEIPMSSHERSCRETVIEEYYVPGPEDAVRSILPDIPVTRFAREYRTVCKR